MRQLLPVVIIAVSLLAVGCAPKEPKRTAGTANLPPERLALVHMDPHGALTAWKGQPVHIDSFYIEEGAYAVAADDPDQQFYVLPGSYTFTIDYGPCLHGWAKVEAPFNTDTGVFEGPYGRFKATLEPGKQYRVVASDKLVGKNAVMTEHRFEQVEKPVVNGR